MKNLFPVLFMFGVVVALLVIDMHPRKINANIDLSCPHVEQTIEYSVSMTCDRDSNVSNLVPEAEKLANQLISNTRLMGLNVMVFETKRGLCRQQVLFQKGTTGRLHSEHILGNAFDIVFLNANGKASWDQSHDWAQLGKLGQDLGLVWGGTFPNYDPGHFELKSDRLTGEEFNKHLTGKYK